MALQTPLCVACSCVDPLGCSFVGERVRQQLAQTETVIKQTQQKNATVTRDLGRIESGIHTSLGVEEKTLM